MQGSTDHPLCDQGRNQLPYLTARFAETPLDAVYCSRTKRAMETANAVAEAHGLQPIVREELRERDAGEYEGWSVGELLQMVGIDRDRGGPRYPFQFEFPTAEPIPDVYERMRHTLEEILEKNCGQAVAVVSHGMALQMAIAFLAGIALPEYTSHRLRNLSITKVLVREDGSAEFAFWDDLSFLPDEMQEYNMCISKK